MRFQLLSDLHLERQPQYLPQVAPGVAVLVLAGDVGSYQAGSRLTDDDFGLARFAPGPGRWQTVLYVPGNHEYDQLDFQATHARLQAVCERLGITLLERRSVVVDGVRFVGTTLWSDSDALAAQAGTLAQQLAAREKAYRAANFYLRRFSTLVDGQPLLAEPMRDLALQCQAWLRAELARPFEGPTVAVTHYAPSLRSADPRYGLTPGTAGFCNALDDLLPLTDVWVHGHLHCPNDYRVGRCRVVANPLGYAVKGEQEGFVDPFVVDLSGPGPG